IQAGINFSSHADSVAVAAGTYVENVNFRGRNIKVVGADRETTIIDGNSSGSVVTFNGGENRDAFLKNFSIINGAGNSISEPEKSSFGGGIQCYHSSPTLENLLVYNNNAGNESEEGWGQGGGIAIQSGSPLINNCRIYSNSTGADGGGLFIASEDGAKLQNVIISENVAGAAGGGIYGEGIFEVNRSLIKDNYCTTFGAPGIDCSVSDVKIINSVITNNLGGDFSGGLRFQGNGSKAEIIHSVFWGNSGKEMYISNDDSLIISYSDIDGDIDSVYSENNGIIEWGSGNVDVDPMFV
ncbi:uncharacterized protein METZ01_LOCUS381783, partial [marine metagenome]